MFIVNIGNQRDMNALFDLADGTGILFLWHGYTYYFTAHFFQTMNLGNRACNITGVGGGHGLYGNGRITTYSYIADMNLSGFPSHDLCYSTRVDLPGRPPGSPFYSSLRYKPSYVEEGDNDHEGQQNCHPDKIDDPFDLWLETFAATQYFKKY